MKGNLGTCNGCGIAFAGNSPHLSCPQCGYSKQTSLKTEKIAAFFKYMGSYFQNNNNIKDEDEMEDATFQYNLSVFDNRAQEFPPTHQNGSDIYEQYLYEDISHGRDRAQTGYHMPAPLHQRNIDHNIREALPNISNKYKDSCGESNGLRDWKEEEGARSRGMTMGYVAIHSPGLASTSKSSANFQIGEPMNQRHIGTNTPTKYNISKRSKIEKSNQVFKLIDSFNVTFFKLFITIVVIALIILLILGLKNDVEKKMSERFDIIEKEINICKNHYLIWNCDPQIRVPMMEEECLKLEKCMIRNSKEEAHSILEFFSLLAECLNHFFDIVTIKTAMFIFLIIIVPLSIWIFLKPGRTKVKR